jgi:hypothetical protein
MLNFHARIFFTRVFATFPLAFSFPCPFHLVPQSTEKKHRLTNTSTMPLAATKSSPTFSQRMASNHACAFSRMVWVGASNRMSSESCIDGLSFQKQAPSLVPATVPSFKFETQPLRTTPPIPELRSKILLSIPIPAKVRRCSTSIQYSLLVPLSSRPSTYLTPINPLSHTLKPKQTAQKNGKLANSTTICTRPDFE